MKKLFCVILSICMMLSIACGCSDLTASQSNVSDQIIIEEIIIDETSTVSSEQTSSVEINASQVESSNQEQDVSNDTTAACQHNYEEKVKTQAQLFSMGKKEYICRNCGDSYMKDYCVEDIKILSISNSYGKNALWELYNICKLEGVKNIDIAVMYVAGCSLDKHWENIQSNNAEYEVFRNNNGAWTSTKNCTIDSLLAEGDWDVITTQNSSGMSGKSDGYKNLNNVADYIKTKCPSAKLIWHMTWGYQSGSEWLKPTTYNGDEKLMYTSIVDCVNNIVIPSGKFDLVVPVGTAVMNARTSSLKNIVHIEDGSHLSEELGYYVAALTWYCKLTGASPYDTAFAASALISNDKMNVVLESVKNAIATPDKTTQSYYAN